MVASSRTKSSTRALSDLARHVVKPSGIVATGWPAVEQTCRVKLGESFDDWQQSVGKLALSKRADGSLATTIGGVGLSVPRQVGKTYLVSRMLFALCINQPGLLAIWTAHHSATHAETFLDMQAFAERSKVAPYIRRVYTGSGDEEVRFLNGSRILFGARDSGFGRGIPGVDIIVFDEAQILTERAIDAMVPTMNTSSIGLHFYIGTPPRESDPPGPRETFTQMRADCLDGKADDTVWVEFGADPGANPDDRRQWAKANPSFPHRTGANAMLRMQRKLGDRFTCEGLGIWPKIIAAGGALPFVDWMSLADPEAEIGRDLIFGLHVDEDRSAWITALWPREDGVNVILANDGLPFPAHKVVEECKERTDKHGGHVVAPKAFEDELTEGEVPMLPMPAGTWSGACGAVADAIQAKTIKHGNQPALNEAVRAAEWRSAGGQGERAFKDASGPLAALVRGLWGADQQVTYDVLESIG